MGKIRTRKGKGISVSPLVWAAVCAVLLTGCGESRAAKEARLAGISQMEAGQYEAALASFQEALDGSDGIVDAFELDILKYRGEAEYRLGDYGAAAHTYGILSEVDEGNAEYLYCKAAAAAQNGDVEEAASDYGKARELDGSRTVSDGENALPAAAAVKVAAAYRDAGDAETAVSFCQAQLDNGMQLAELYNQKALSLMELERYEEALTALEQGLALGDENAASRLRYHMGVVHEWMGDFAGALAIFQDYISAYGSTPELEKEIAFLESR